LDKSYKILQRIEHLQRLNSEKDWINDTLYRLLYSEDLYIIAYERIKSKPGNMTSGTDGAKRATGFKAVMRALNRKQIPTCTLCHKKIHKGEYDGINLKDFAYDPH